MNGLTALVLAGSRGPDEPVARAAGVAHKALADVGGAPMLLRVVQALAATPRIGAIVVAVERPDLLQDLPALQPLIAAGRLSALPAQAGPSASVAAAFDTLGAPLLVTTADHALLRPEWIEAFLHGVDPTADVSAAVAGAEDVRAAVPGARRTFLRFSDGWVSGCNLFHLATPQAADVVALWRRLEALRKQPWRMAAVLGPGVLARYLAGRLSRGAALERLGRLSGARLGLVQLADGLAAVDVDTPEDLALVRRLVDQPSAPSQA